MIVMLEVKNLVKKFGNAKTPAVRGVTFDIKPGEVFALIGPNASGKTTIIKTIAGLLQPSAGEIFVGGVNITKDPVGAKSQLGYIPDEPSVWAGMTGEEFLHFSGALYGIGEKERTNAIPHLLDIFGLRGTEAGYFEDYSRGNKQKFSILAALMHRPKLLLIDEPIVGLDPHSADIAKKEFAKFASLGGSVLLVTHTLSVAHEIASRIGVLKDGALVITGTIDELREKTGVSAEASLEDVYSALA
jgi:ABC-2 type transport system ATP-binding protein